MTEKEMSPYKRAVEENCQKIIAALIHLPGLIHAEYGPGEHGDIVEYRIRLRFKNLPDEEMCVDII